MIDLIIKQYDRRINLFSNFSSIGTIMLYSASWYESFLSKMEYRNVIFKNHLKRLLIGVIFLISFLVFDYRN